MNETIRNQNYGHDQVGWYVIKLKDPSQAEAIAQKLDAMFANSPNETKTATEKAFVAGFAKQIGDIGSIMIAIAGAVLFTILLVSANTMAQAIRERTNELAILKTLGFSDGRILGAGAGRVVPDRDRRRRARAGGGVPDRLATSAIQTNGMVPAALSAGARTS